MVTQTPTARLLKETVALLSNGVTVDLIASSAGPIPGSYETITLWTNEEQFRRSMRQSNADIFHVHNQPDHLLELMARDSRPIVCDVHDLLSVMTGKVGEFERSIYNRSDAILHVSNPMLEHFRAVHGNGKPDTVIENFCSKAVLSEARKAVQKKDRYPGPKEPITVVYEGSLTGGGDATPEFDECAVMGHYDQRDTVRELLAAGIKEFHVYPATGQSGQQNNEKAGAIIHGCIGMAQMAVELGKYRWGFLGNANRFKQWDVSMPNKLFDYVAAGIPIVCWNAAEPAKWIEREGIGIVIKDPKEIIERNGEAERCRENLNARAFDWTWENQVHRLEKLYAKVL
jgi:hypothetical protein